MVEIMTVLGAFALAVLLIKLRVHLGLAMVAGSLVPAVVYGRSPSEICRTVLGTVSSGQTLELVAIVAFILILSHAMSGTGQFRRLLDHLQRLVGDVRILLVTMPALIGLLPMPGGAVFSAPMIDASADNGQVDPVRKSVINFWFRHIWEYCWPLYPGLILAVKLSGIPMRTMMRMQAPLTLAALAAGLAVLLPSAAKLGAGTGKKGSPDDVRQVALALSPIVLIIFMMLVLKIHLLIALPAGILLVFLINRLPLRDALRYLFTNKKVPSMVGMVVGIMLFKAMLEDTGALVRLVDALQEYQIPLGLLVFLLPFLAGLVTGISVAFVGIAYPVLIPLVGGDPSLTAAYTTLAFAAGFTGVLLSPVHICLLLSNEYFGVPLRKVYPYLLPPGAVVTAVGILMFLFYR